MKILIPTQLFLRVKEKNYAHFAHKDYVLGRDPLAVYLRVFTLAIDTGFISLPQKEIADDIRLSVRQLQKALRFLEDHKYLKIDRTPGSWCTYTLLLSDHIMALLKKHDLIDNPQWYARQKSSSGKRVQPPHHVQGGYAHCAHPSYMEDKKDKKENTSLQTSPPVISKVTPPDAPGGENPSSAASEDFETLWASWPVKQDKVAASKAFARLQRGRKLPDMPTLLAIIEKFRTSDRRWLNGFAPNLSNWLRGERWNDEVIATEKANSSKENENSLSSVPAALPMMPEVPTKPLAELSSDLVAAAEELCQIWPDKPARTPVKALFRFRIGASGSLNPAAMLLSARKYLRESNQPVGLLRWLRDTLGGHHEESEASWVCQGRVPCMQS